MLRLPGLLLRLLLSLCLVASGAESVVAGIQMPHASDMHSTVASSSHVRMHGACAHTTPADSIGHAHRGAGHDAGSGCCKSGACDCASTQASVPLLRDLQLRGTMPEPIIATTHFSTHVPPVLGTLIRPPIG